MTDTIMSDREHGVPGIRSVLDVDKPPDVAVSFRAREVIDISSDEESVDNDEYQFVPSRVGSKKKSKPGSGDSLISELEGVLNNDRQQQNQTRVQGGRITKPTASNPVVNNEHGAQRTGMTVSPPSLQLLKEQLRHQTRTKTPTSNVQGRVLRSGRQLHDPIPQSRETRSGRGQIPQYEPRRPGEGSYSLRSLNSRVIPRHRNLPHGEYTRPDRNSPCLPFVLQITILRSLQVALESMCFRFIQKWLPRILVANDWNCPENLELNLFWNAIERCEVPIEAINLQANRPLSSLFLRVKDIRHLAVHRIPDVSIASIDAMITDAIYIARVFRDDSYVPKFNLWREKLEYFSKVLRVSSGNLDTARIVDSIRTKKEDNISSQEKLSQEIDALKNEILGKEQQILTLQGEYNTHLTNEMDLVRRARDGGRPNIQEVKPLGNFKWLEECLTLYLDRDAPNLKPAENLSGNVIMLQQIGFRQIPPPRPNVGVGLNMRGASGIDSNVSLMPAQQNTTAILHYSREHGLNVLHRTSHSWFRPGSIYDISNTDGQKNISRIPGLGRRAVSGPVTSTRSRNRAPTPIPATATIFDLTGDDDDDVMEG